LLGFCDAVVFCDSKSTLSPEEIDCPFFDLPETEMDDWIIIRTRYTLKVLTSLDESKVAEPDQIPAKVLKKIAKYIIIPFIVLYRHSLNEGY